MQVHKHRRPGAITSGEGNHVICVKKIPWIDRLFVNLEDEVAVGEWEGVSGLFVKGFDDLHMWELN